MDVTPIEPEPRRAADPAAAAARRWKLAFVAMACVALVALVAAVVFAMRASDADQRADKQQAAARQAQERAEEATAELDEAEQDADVDAGADADADADADEPDVVEDCGPFDVTGVDGGLGAGYYDISVRNTSCADAKQVILGLDMTSSSPSGDGYSCTKIGELGETTTWRCERADAAIRFSLGA